MGILLRGGRRCQPKKVGVSTWPSKLFYLHRRERKNPRRVGVDWHLPNPSGHSVQHTDQTHTMHCQEPFTSDRIDIIFSLRAYRRLCKNLDFFSQQDKASRCNLVGYDRFHPRPRICF